MSSNPCARSPLSVVEEAVRQLCHSSTALRIEAARLGLEGCAGELSMVELREVLGRRDTPVAAKNRAWVLLITQAQRENQAQANGLGRSEDRGWALAAIAVALPGLRAVAGEFAHGARGSRADLEEEVLAGFLTALMQARTVGQQRFPALIRAARRAGLAWLRDTRDAPPATGDSTAAAPAGGSGAHRGGHPDVVLAQAVEAGILTGAEAEIIAATRLERQPLREVAAAHGVSANAVWMRRDRAEKRLVAALARACGPDDADHANDPTHAHLLATTSLIHRLPPSADHPAAKPTTRAQRRPHAGTAHPPTRPHSHALTNPSSANARVSTGQRTDTDPDRAHPGHGHSISAPSSPTQSPPAHSQPGHHHSRRGQSHPDQSHPDQSHPDQCRLGQRPDRPTTRDRPDHGHSDPRQPGAGHTRDGRDDDHAPTSTNAQWCPVRAATLLAPGNLHICKPGPSHPHPGSVGGAAIPVRHHRGASPRMSVWITTLMLIVGLAISSDIETPSRGGPASHQAAVAVITIGFVTPAPTPQSTPKPRPRARMRWSLHPFDRDGRAPRERLLVPAQASPDGTAQLTRVLNNIRNWLLGLLITLATLCLTIGGVRYLLAGGDPGEVEAAKRAIKSAAIGYSLAVLAPAFVAILHNLVGA